MKKSELRAEIERLKLHVISFNNKTDNRQADIDSNRAEAHREGVREAWRDIEERLKERGIDLLKTLMTTSGEVTI